MDRVRTAIRFTNIALLILNLATFPVLLIVKAIQPQPESNWKDPTPKYGGHRVEWVYNMTEGLGCMGLLSLIYGVVVLLVGYCAGLMTGQSALLLLIALMFMIANMTLLDVIAGRNEATTKDISDSRS